MTDNIKIADREIVFSRLINAPRELVWQVWTEPEHLSKWWGPVGFTTVIHKLEVYPGGAFELDMNGPQNTYSMRGKYLEVLKHERLVFNNVGPGGNGNHYPVHYTVTFADEGGKTKVTLQALVSNITPEALPYFGRM